MPLQRANMFSAWFDSLRKRLRAKDALSHKWLLEHVKAGRLVSGLQKSSPRSKNIGASFGMLKAPLGPPYEYITRVLPGF